MYSAVKISKMLVMLLGVVCVHRVFAAAPQLYRQAHYQSPVRADPDDLLLLAGYGLEADDTVVYAAVSDTTRELRHPAEPPVDPATAASGTLRIVDAGDVPYSLTVKLPSSIRSDQSYALWIRTARGEWSTPLLVNDARPLWSSPAYAYATAAIASLPRELKVIGRNLQPAPGSVTRIRLTGPELYVGTAMADSAASPAMSRYVARLRLPMRLTPGHYRVDLSRDGVGWVAVADQSFDVMTDPSPPDEYAVSDPRFGGCRPDDDLDDTGCILAAIAAARQSRSAAIVFSPGTWDVIDSTRPGVVASGGIVVPEGVQLRGAGNSLTRLRRHAQWDARRATAVFTLLGHTQVTGFTFQDAKVYAPHDVAGPFLQVGENFQRIRPDDARTAMADDVVISHNDFDKTMIAIADGGLPIRRLFITYNNFGAYHSALELGGNRFNMTEPYRIDDSVIDGNVFKPSSKLDLAGKTGTIASELGAGRRLDFSGNIADGSSTDYLYSRDDPGGWRAAFFWNLEGNVEETLTSQNIATCTGDKIGDGEAIAYDNNGNTFAFESAASVVEATSVSVKVSVPLVARQNDREVPLGSYYLGHWLQIASGPGLGQARRIVGYSIDADTHATTFHIAPAWDVVPVPGHTRITVGREFWQVYTLDNLIDHRQPLCHKSNRSKPAGGQISLWGQSADSVIEGNRQFDTSGIIFQQAYLVPEHPCPTCTMESFLQSFLQVRGNTIDGEYDWARDCSSSGIVAGIAASPWHDTEPPTLGFGVDIAHNRIRHADETRGGAITQVDTWYAGPEPHRWPLSDGMLIQHNSIEDVDGPAARPRCGGTHPRVGIRFPDQAIAWHTVLYANACLRVSRPIGGKGTGTVAVCPSSAAPSCECP